MAPSPTQKVISASRRTDIPAFYMDWFMERIDKGFFEITNPYNGKTSILTATPEKIHTIVFWSKNFGPFISGEFGRRLQDSGYHLFFNFTLNSVSKALEPNVPSLETRLKQMAALCRLFGPESIHWRFDPVCFYQEDTDRVANNLHDFRHIAQRVADGGISRCITSFLDIYPKIIRRLKTLSRTCGLKIRFIDPPRGKKAAVLLQMQQILAPFSIRLQTCCEQDILDALPMNSGITGSACIPNRRLVELFGGKLSFARDAGQRRKQGCGCLTSVDIGSYRRHPCYHNCLFCYANPVSGFPGTLAASSS